MGRHTCQSFELSDFSSNWDNGLRIHNTRMHMNIEQLDGCEDGYLGTVFQTFLDTLDIL